MDQIFSDTTVPETKSKKTPKPKLHRSLKLEDNLKVIFVIITVETKNKDF